MPKKYPPGTTATHFETLCALHHQEGLVKPQYVDIPNGASTEAREWLPSLLCYCFTLDALDRDSREAMEELLNREPHVTVKNTTYNWSDVPHGTKLRSVWSSPTKLAGLRNDVLHAGFRRNPEKSQQVLEQTTKIMAELREIARLWYLGDAQ